MTEVSMMRLYALRAGYLLLAAGLAATIWPRLLNHGADWPPMDSVVAAMLGALSLLSLLGFRYPLEMLPMLLFDLVWKLLWLGLVAMPLWLSGELNAHATSIVTDCLVAALLIPLIPWRYVARRYLRARGAPWRAGRPAAG